MRITSLILAKSHSNRLENKNKRDFCGKPVFLWNVEKLIDVFGECYVSSDGKEILDMAEKAGATPIGRPERLCGEAPNISVYDYCFEQMKRPDIIVAVQACSPTVPKALMKKTKEIMLGGCQELMTVYPIQWKENYHEQDFKLYGSIWALTEKRLRTYNDPYKPNPEILLIDNSVDIHTIEDFKLAEKQCRLRQAS